MYSHQVPNLVALKSVSKPLLIDLTKRTIDAVLETTGFSLLGLAALLDTDSSRISKYRKRTRQLPPLSEAMLTAIGNFLQNTPSAPDHPSTEAERLQLEHDADELRWQATKIELSLAAAKIAYAHAKAQIQVCHAFPHFLPAARKNNCLLQRF